MFCFNHLAPTELYTLSLHDALPIFPVLGHSREQRPRQPARPSFGSLRRGPQPLPIQQRAPAGGTQCRSEEHTSELQSHHDLVCRLLLEKKKTNRITIREPKTSIPKY